MSGADAGDERVARLSALGPQRARLLDCLGGNTRLAPGYFSPPPGADVIEAFTHHVADLSTRWSGETDPLTVGLLAAARLLTGDAAAARPIVDRLPTAPARLDHGAGYCLVAPQQALAGALPLPQELSDIRRWLADSAEQAALRAWLDRYEPHLRWDRAAGVYRLVEAASAPFR